MLAYSLHYRTFKLYIVCTIVHSSLYLVCIVVHSSLHPVYTRNAKFEFAIWVRRPGWSRQSRPRQRRVLEDRQPGLVRRQPPQEQHGGGGGDGDAAAPGRNRCAHSLHILGMRDTWFAQGLLTKISLHWANRWPCQFAHSLHGLHQIYTGFTPSLHQNNWFVWGQPVVLNWANSM